jgi:hypothetical protein
MKTIIYSILSLEAKRNQGVGGPMFPGNDRVINSPGVVHCD